MSHAEHLIRAIRRSRTGMTYGDLEALRAPASEILFQGQELTRSASRSPYVIPVRLRRMARISCSAWLMLPPQK